MSVCGRIQSGQDSSCLSFQKRYYQQLVLVNRDDVRNKIISTSSITQGGEYICRHRVYFDLLEGTSGFRFTVSENANTIFGTAEKSEQRGVVQYSHTVGIVIMGIDEPTKCLLSQLDNSDYFAALQNYDGTVEIYGFEYGLTTNGYVYDPSNTNAGTSIKLISNEDVPEDELPFIYKSQTGTENEDFNNNFAGTTLDIFGDFNDDFNNDFNNQQ